MSYKTILVSEDEGVQTIMLNRPARRNAMTPEMQDELIAALEKAAKGHSRVVVITGAGEAFCAGLDLEHLRSLVGRSQADHVGDAARVAKLFRTLYELPKPTIAAVQGAAIAGGAGLATICDYTLAAPGVKFGFNEVRLGFVPALVSAFLALQVGDKRARGLLLSGRPFSSEEAQEMGLVNEIVEPEEIAERASTLARELMGNSPQALAATKQLMAQQNEAWLTAAIAHAMTANAEVRAQQDFSEGITAYLEKRAPVWSR